jgi:hypothetical protein
MVGRRTVEFRNGARIVLLSALLVVLPRAMHAQACAGDCDGSGAVAIHELVAMVGVALERLPLSVCLAGDTGGDGAIAIEEIIAGVDAALVGCGASATPTPTISACTSVQTLCQPGQSGSYCCTLNGSFFAALADCEFSGNYADPTPNTTPGKNGCWSAADSTCQTQYVCLSGGTAATATATATATPPTATATHPASGSPTASATPSPGGPTPTPSASPSATSTATATCPSTPTPTPSPTGPTQTPSATATPGAPNLYQALGIGADWGPHWSASTTAIDPRDNQDDSAFPAEICLVANAGFQSIRLYGENVETWMAVVQAVQTYNQGSLVCRTGQTMPPAQPLAVVYQVAICGPDPSSLPWNGAVTPDTIDTVTCRPAPGQMEQALFVQSLQAEILKLKQVLRYAGTAFADTVQLVFVGNEILFSRGTCAGGSDACSSNGDCASGVCNIAHYCSNTLAGEESQATACTQQSDCGAVDGPKGLCTDVTNVQVLAYAFDQVQQVLAVALGGDAVPPISISLQVDVMTGTTPGLPAATAPLLWSRQQLAAALSSQVVAVNAYPDQWGLVPAAGSVPPYPSCIEAGNAVHGTVLDPSVCPGAAAAYENPATGTLAHTIDTDYQLLTRYYPGFQIVLAETGWHTAGTCSAYNDDSIAPDRYSPAAAATYLGSLYQYVADNQIPLLVFELFDQQTKTCAIPAGTVAAEANYGVFTNYCQVKQAPAPLPTGADLKAFDALLSAAPGGGVSCQNQALLTVQGVGNTGVCAWNTTASCLSDCGTAGPCVWGYCQECPSMGCNPDDPNNPTPCTCTRAGNCYDATTPSGYYASTTAPLPVCDSAAACSSAACPFGACGCYVAMAPATLPDGSRSEGAGALVRYSNGAFTFEKAVGPLALVQPLQDGTFIAQPLWDNLVVGPGWTVDLLPPAGAMSGGTPSPCSNTVHQVTPGPAANITWMAAWDCAYDPMPDTTIGVEPTSLSLPRSFLATIPTWPPPQ